MSSRKIEIITPHKNGCKGNWRLAYAQPYPHLVLLCSRHRCSGEIHYKISDVIAEVAAAEREAKK